MKEHEEILITEIDKNINDLKSKASSFINKIFSPLNLKNSPYSSNQPSADINKWPLLKSPYFPSRASQFTKHQSPMTLEGKTLLQLQKWWYSICSTFCESLSTNKIWPLYMKLKEENYYITKYLLPPYTHSKYITAKTNLKNYQEHSEFVLLKIPPSHHQKHPNHMSNSLIT